MLKVFILAVLFALQTVPGGADETVGRYFPADAWEPLSAWTQEERSQFYERWFGRRLAAMKEPSLAFADSSERGPNEIRLLFLPSNARVTMLRISYSDKQEVSFEFKMLSRVGSGYPGDLIVHTTGTVDEGDAERIFALLEAIAPWSDTATPVDRGLCYDGTMTLLEFRKGDAYHLIDRHECDLAADDNIRKLIHAFNDVSDGQVIAPHTKF